MTSKEIPVGFRIVDILSTGPKSCETRPNHNPISNQFQTTWKSSRKNLQTEISSEDNNSGAENVATTAGEEIVRAPVSHLKAAKITTEPSLSFPLAHSSPRNLSSSQMMYYKLSSSCAMMHRISHHNHHNCHQGFGFYPCYAPTVAPADLHFIPTQACHNGGYANWFYHSVKLGNPRGHLAIPAAPQLARELHCKPFWRRNGEEPAVAVTGGRYIYASSSCASSYNTYYGIQDIEQDISMRSTVLHVERPDQYTAFSQNAAPATTISKDFCATKINGFCCHGYGGEQRKTCTLCSHSNVKLSLAEAIRNRKAFRERKVRGKDRQPGTTVKRNRGKCVQPRLLVSKTGGNDVTCDKHKSQLSCHSLENDTGRSSGSKKRKLGNVTEDEDTDAQRKTNCSNSP
eukprot:gene7701-8538_t